MGLAISLGRVDAVRAFLAVVPDVNDPILAVWGYRQPYTLAHLALDPRFPYFLGDNVPLKNQLEIIDALGERGANFNAILKNSKLDPYTNPPLAAGGPSGYADLKLMPHLQARALLYGADPAVKGSCFHGVDLTRDEYNAGPERYPYFSKLLHPAFEYYQERMQAGFEANLKPVPAVMGYFEKIAQERGVSWPIVGVVPAAVTSLIKNDSMLQESHKKLESQLQRIQEAIATFASQSTKKAKGRTRHLRLIEAEFQKKIKELNRQIRRSDAN